MSEAAEKSSFKWKQHLSYLQPPCHGTFFGNVLNFTQNTFLVVCDLNWAFISTSFAGSDVIIKCYITIVNYYAPYPSSLYITQHLWVSKMSLPWTNEKLMLGEGYPSCPRPHEANSRTTKLIADSSVLLSPEFTHISLLLKCIV